MLRKDNFQTGFLYHIYNRGTDKKICFADNADYKRFLHSLEKFNKFERVHNTSRVIGQQTDNQEISPLINLHEYCLMPNHYHLVIEQLEDNGISKFLQKVMTGYTMYFNKRYERTGVVFQGRTKSKLIDNEEYRMWLKDYLAFNPLDLCDPNWKEKGIRNEKDALMFLKNYEWRSDYDFSSKDVSGFLKDAKENNFSPF